MAKGLSREEKIALYEKMVATYPDAVLKGDTIPYTSLNGHMYSFISKENTVALKLPKDELVKFMEKYSTTHPVNYGVMQKDYVIVPDSLLMKTDELRPYFEMSYEYTSKLKPKPTTKSKKKD